MATHKLCAIADLQDPGSREFSIGEGEWPLRGFVVLFQGQLCAFVNRCPHLGWPLNFRPDVFFAPHVDLLQCSGHGALFEPHSGKCVAGPCAGQNLQALKIQVIDETVYLIHQPDIPLERLQR